MDVSVSNRLLTRQKKLEVKKRTKRIKNKDRNAVVGSLFEIDEKFLVGYVCGAKICRFLER